VPSEPAAGFLTGAVVGAATGSIAGPAGFAVGALVGGALGGIAGVALEEEEERRDQHDANLDEELGVTSRPMKGTWEETLDKELSGNGEEKPT
jgi:phage tail tape-measure protein